MKTRCLEFVLALAWGIPALSFAQTSSPQVQAVEVAPTKIRAYFTPGHMVESAITDEIGAARSEIRVQAYSFTNPLIVQALADARVRGVDVILLLDKSNRTQK